MSGDVGDERSFEWKKPPGEPQFCFYHVPPVCLPHTISLGVQGRLSAGQTHTALWETMSLGLRIGHLRQVVSLVIQHSSPLCCQCLCPLLQISMSPSPAPHCPIERPLLPKGALLSVLEPNWAHAMQVFHFLSCDSSCQWCLHLQYKQQP